MVELQHIINVMIVDDHLMIREGLKVFLSIFTDIVVVAEAADGEQAFLRCAEYLPDVILMDIMMPKVDGLTATARIRQAFPEVQIIALTNAMDERLVPRTIQAGAISYLVKDVHADQLVATIRDAFHGRSTNNRVTHAFTQATKQSSAPDYALTKREREVLALLVAGRTNNMIAARLTISPGTVRLHVSNILTKLHVSNRTEATTFAIQQGLV